MTATVRHLKAAVGYLGLGMPMDAWNELEQIDPEQRSRLDVLNVRLEVCRVLKKWELMVEIAQHLREMEPDDAGHLLNLAFAMRRFKDEQAAAEILEEAKGRFPQEGTIPYNLACYRAVAGQVEEAKVLLKQAIVLDADLRSKALDDPDLDGVWDSV